MTRRDDRAAVPVAALPGIPLGADGPAFREPWEAQAFAMAIQLHERGVFTWNEWADCLAAEIKAAQAEGDPDTGTTYYRHWLAALERLATAKALTGAAELEARRAQWQRAADATPHGQPIALANDPRANDSLAKDSRSR